MMCTYDSFVGLVLRQDFMYPRLCLVLSTSPKMTLNFGSPCLHLPSARITGTYTTSSLMKLSVCEIQGFAHSR